MCWTPEQRHGGYTDLTMLPRLLFVGLILLNVAPTLEGHLHYAVILPSEIHGPGSQLACFNFNGAEGQTSIQLNLTTSAGIEALIEKTFEDESVFSCLPFQVSKPTKKEVVATMEVSITTPTETIVNQTKVLLWKPRSGTLIQTDKPVYKPGQTVKFRILILKENLQPMNKQIAFVELQDPEKNRIGQWLNVKLSHGISEFSFALSPEPILGEYTIRVEDTAHMFSVEEYVLPKFEVTMKLPPVVLVNSESFEVKVCGRYTYGKPMRGVYHGSVCRSSTYYMWYWRRPSSPVKDLCCNITGQLDRSGCGTFILKPDNFKLMERYLDMTLRGKASIIEDGTGIEISTSSTASISANIEQLSFVEADENYKPGLPYSMTLKLEDPTGQPIPNRLIHFTIHGDNNVKTTTDSDGIATFTVNDTAAWNGHVSITAKTNLDDHPYSPDFIQPQYGNAYLSLLPFYSPSKSFLKLQSDSKNLPCEGQHEVRVEYIINHNELKPDTKKLHLHYLLASEASIWSSGSKDILVEKVGQDLSGSTSFNFPLTPDVSPKLRVLVHILLPGGEIVADSAKFTVQRCFKNKVSVQFSPGDVLPGSDVSLQIQAGARSLCGLRVVDQSVVLMKPEKELTDDKVHSLFHRYDYGEYDYRIQEPEPNCFQDFGLANIRHVQPLPKRISRSMVYPGHHSKHVDVYKLFKETRLKIITSSIIRKPPDCGFYDFIQYSKVYDTGIAGPAGAPGVENDQQKVEKIRKYFPETWLWQLTATGNSGIVVLHETAPDTITDWNAGAFCMGPSGFGLSPPTSLRVFQPFFVDLTLPYSVVRGESFTLKASVFNYLKECIKVKVTLGPSEELAKEPCANCPRTSCLCADESKTFYWNLKAKKLGKVNITVRTEAVDTEELCHNELPIVPKQRSIDTVIKPLLVQPEGILEEKSHSSLLCVQKDQAESAEEEISLKVPENIVKDSVRAHMTVLGDLMGTAMQNVDRLLAMPYGCGEQNMVLFAPNIFILQYLEKTHQLNEEILAKAKTFLEGGYQRQLTYKHRDGSYSAFGKSDPEGNTWLTAFVVKSFSKARPYIFIDETYLNQSFAWLKNHRSVSGCFESVGRLFNNAMKGGVEDEISLSAYVTTALLESGLSKEDPLVADALTCLRKAAVDVSNVYTQALLAYTFTLAEDTETRQILLEKLEKQAVRKDGQLHWERPSAKPTSDLPYWYQAPSAEVELTAYMLMTGLSGPEKDLGRASEIVNWLSKQQNPYGGFSSTQDTVVALQSLGQYAGATFSDAGDVTVTVRSQTGVQEFHVDNTNRLLLQKASLPDIPGDYTLTASGSGCVYVQTVLRYNVPPPRSDATFSIRVEVKPDQCPKEVVKKLQLQITVQYTGSREKSNMALIEVKMLSGFIPVKSSVKELEKSRRIQRGDVQTDMVTLYLDEVGGGFTQLVFEVEQDFDVKNLKPAAVKIYDYYETGEHAVTEYNSPCSSEEKRTN